MSVVGSILSTPTTATPASSTVPASSSASASATPTLQFVGLGEMFTCGISPIRWAYTGPSASMSLNITNINVSQQAPLSSSTSSSTSSSSVTVTSTSNGTTSTPTSVAQRDFKRQYSGYGGSYLPNINEQLANQLDPTTNNYTWSGVNVPQGWYQLEATVQGVLQTSSSSFFVLNGTNVACIPQFAVSSATSLVPVSTSPASSQSAVVAASSGHSHAGAIAGGVIGGIAFFAAALVAFLFWFLRRRSRGAENKHRRSWSAMALKRPRRANEGRLSTHEELSTVGHEKAISSIPPPILPYDPSHPQANRSSTLTTGSQSRVMSNPPPSYLPHVGDVPVQSRPPTAGERPQTAGSRRKPAPRYEEAGGTMLGDNGGNSSSTTLDSIHGNGSRQSHGNVNVNSDAHALQHQSSFGAMRPMHVMMPDPPPPART
ncbi:hypothetical protein EI94DRAFT_1179326 [Lactarius quietus]|nr:hypothetical protein EI94DRAFT_1179326 [Lactarius quietus]